MQDIGIFYEDFTFKLKVEKGDLVGDDGLETSVIISLFTDKRVSQENLPQGQTSRRGYWGDMFPDVEGDQIGSRLWTLDRSKILPQTLTAFENEARDCLQWMLDDNVAKTIEVSASTDEFDRLSLSINITKPDDQKNLYGFIWDGQEVRRKAV